MTANESLPEPAQGPTSVPAQSAGPGAVQLLSLLLRHLPLVAGAGFVVGMAVGISVLNTPQNYSSRVSFVPQQPSQQAPAFAGIAAQFGISLGGGQSSESPAFYAELLRSRELLRRIAARSYEVQTDSGLVVASLAEVYGLDYPEADRRLFEATDLVEDITSITPSTRTGIVQISVRTKWPDLSQQISQAYLDEVNRFNLEVRRGRAAAEQAFAEDRLDESRGELRAAEDSLELFMERNRVITSPAMEMQLDRYTRQVNILQQVVTSLASSYEQARIDAVRNTPVIAVIEPARRPVVGDARGTIRKSALAAAAAGLLALIFSLMRERLRYATLAGDPEVEELTRNLRRLSPLRRG